MSVIPTRPFVSNQNLVYDVNLLSWVPMTQPLISTDTLNVTFSTPVAVTGPLTDAQLRATPVPVSGPLTDTQLRATAVPVSGPLTDTQLRATAVPVSGPLTDTQLRATAVPVSGPLTDTQLRATAVPVSGPLTDTQLRATAVPVSMASTPLPSNAAQETGGNLAAIKAKTDNIPAQGQAAMAASLPVVVASDQSVLIVLAI